MGHERFLDGCVRTGLRGHDHEESDPPAARAARIRPETETRAPCLMTANRCRFAPFAEVPCTAT
jgi:hypothetical protein